MISEVAACASIASQPSSRHLHFPTPRSHRHPATGPAQLCDEDLCRSPELASVVS